MSTNKTEMMVCPLVAPAGVGGRVSLYVWSLTKHFRMLFWSQVHFLCALFFGIGRRIWNKVFVLQSLHNQCVKLPLI